MKKVILAVAVLIVLVCSIALIHSGYRPHLFMVNAGEFEA